jgi:protein SCO1/2
VFFVSVTVDPERDRAAVLKGYGTAHGARFDGWAFLTGTSAEIRDVANRYGIFYKKTAGGDVDHTFLTSLVDARGLLRVQYLGVRFQPTELLSDVRSLVGEASPR